MKTLTFFLTLLFILFLRVVQVEACKLKDRTNGKYDLPNPQKPKPAKVYTV